MRTVLKEISIFLSKEASEIYLRKVPDFNCESVKGLLQPNFQRSDCLLNYLNLKTECTLSS